MNSPVSQFMTSRSTESREQIVNVTGARRPASPSGSPMASSCPNVPKGAGSATSTGVTPSQSLAPGPVVFTLPSGSESTPLQPAAGSPQPNQKRGSPGRVRCSTLPASGPGSVLIAPQARPCAPAGEPLMQVGNAPITAPPYAGTPSGASPRSS